METNPLLSKHLSESKTARYLVLFGGSPVMRDKVIRHLSSIPELSTYGTLSEEEGYQTILELDRVDLVLIGGRYTTEQRKRIKEFLLAHAPATQVLEPGVSFPYSSSEIHSRIKTTTPAK